MQYDTITYDLHEGAATITLNRPDVMNSFNGQMRAEVTDAFLRAGKEARAVVLTGAGRAFCSGQDLGDGASLASVDLERLLRDEYEPLLRAITECPVPTVSAVNGAAAGAGANIAMSTDVVIATESAYFVQAFSRIGLIPDAGGTWFLPRKVGLAKAMGAALFGEKVTATQAHDWGMIWEVVPDDAFSDHVARRVTYLANGPTQAFAHLKTAMQASFGNSLGQQLTLEAKLQGQSGKTRDFKEGVVAFVEKRPASFEGR